MGYDEPMDAAELADIYNYRQLSNRLASSGQPDEEEFGAIARADFQVVINLGLSGEYYSLPDERRTVRALGMTYEHIPVEWQEPARADLDTFFRVMDHYAEQRVLVHCAANFRASAFIMLYRVLRLGWDIDDALPDMLAIWQPNDVWQGFIAAMLEDALPKV
jgi:uncharacterized protein (TIGR01244 family)